MQTDAPADDRTRLTAALLGAACVAGLGAAGIALSAWLGAGRLEAAAEDLTRHGSSAPDNLTDAWCAEHRALAKAWADARRAPAGTVALLVGLAADVPVPLPTECAP